MRLRKFRRHETRPAEPYVPSAAVRSASQPTARVSHGGLPARPCGGVELRFRLRAVRHLYRHWGARSRLRLQPRLDRALHAVDLGSAGSGDSDLDARKRIADRSRARREPEQRALHAHGGRAPADAQGRAHATASPDSAGPSHRDQRLGGRDATVTHAAARPPHRLLQWPRDRPDLVRGRWRRGRLPYGGGSADRVRGGPVVSHPALHADVDRAQQRRAARSPGARAGHRTADRGDQGRARPDVDRHHCRHHRLCGSPAARGDAMNAALTDLGPYLALLLVGFLPNEIWRMLGLLVARGLNEESEIVVWVRAVATAILAGVIAQLIVTSTGALATVPLSVRIAAVAGGFLAFVAVRRSVFAGVAVGEAVLIVGAMLMSRVG